MLMTTKLDAMGHRWVTHLGPYSFTLNYKLGKLNPADPLSRIGWQSVDTTEFKATLDLVSTD